MGLIERLKFVVENDFERLTYTEAINILRNSKPNKKEEFQYLLKDSEQICNRNTSVI